MQCIVHFYVKSRGGFPSSCYSFCVRRRYMQIAHILSKEANHLSESLSSYALALIHFFQRCVLMIDGAALLLSSMVIVVTAHSQRYSKIFFSAAFILNQMSAVLAASSGKKSHVEISFYTSSCIFFRMLR